MLKIFCVGLALILIIFNSKAQHYTKVTYYNLPGITASGESVRPGICAVSPDLERHYPLGSYIKLEGYGVLKVSDKTASYIRNTIDVWSATPINNGTNVKCEKHHIVDRNYRNYLVIPEDE